MSETGTARRLADTPIAIVGIAGLYPRARDAREFWQNIVDARDCIEDVPPSRWSVDDHYDPDPSVPDKIYSKRGGFVPDVSFDPMEFGLPPNLLEVTSTLQTLSLVVARDLLADAGATPDGWYRPDDTGVVLGVTGTVPLVHPLASRLAAPVLREVSRAAGLTEAEADGLATRFAAAFAPWEENSFPGALPNVTAGRIANRLGLGGMNCTVDAACAASLSAVRMAIAELVDGRADMMITGGAETDNSPFGYMCFSATGALSKSDRIRPFDESADGTLVGEGIGMIALRRLADAERDGNRIYAVIRGIGSSSDGRAKSIYAPRAEGQDRALRRAYADADCSPASVALFEAHATGTAVGDRTELTALTALLRDAAGDEDHVAAVGSVKSQIGHTKGAAGTASLMKLAFSLYHKTLPPTINVDRPNAEIAGDTGPLYVNTRTRPWIRDPRRPVRRAAASAMGFGGTNFHVVLEEHDPDRPAGGSLHQTARAFLWHAPDPAALLAAVAAGEPTADGPVPETHARIGFVATGEDADRLRQLAAEQLAAAGPDSAAFSHPTGIHYRRRALADPRVGALFAGQGSQYLDMGLEAALNIPTVATAIEDANAASADGDATLAAVMYPPPVFDAAARQRQEARLRATEHAQPAIGALSAGQYRYLTELGLRCAGFLGHSFGELTALWAAGSLGDEDYFRLARARGAAMAAPAADADPGAMAAVAASREEITAILADFPDLVVCNHNAPDQVVVGGATAAVEALLVELGRRGLTGRSLPVSAAFHTRHVAHALDRFAAELAGVTVGAPSAPVFANTAGASYGEDPDANRAVLSGQILAPVEFVAAVSAMRASGCNVLVEFGPKQVLGQLARRILGDGDVEIISTDGGPLRDSDATLKLAALRLAVLGLPISGINRHDAADRAAARPRRARAMSVTLSGAEYVPDARRAAYREGLTDGFRVAGTATAPVAKVPAAAGFPERAVPAAAGSALPAVPTPPAAPVEPAAHLPAVTGYGDAATTPTAPGVYGAASAANGHAAAAAGGVGAAAARHLDLHTRYLDTQLRVTEDLVGLLRGTAAGGEPPAWIPDAVAQVADQSLAVGRAHTRASEVLAALAGLGLGAGTPPGPRPGLPAPATGNLASLPPAGAISAPAPAIPPAAPMGPAPGGILAPRAAWPTATPGPADVASNGHHPPAAATAPAAVPAVPDGPAASDEGAVRSALLAVVADRTGYPAEMIDTAMDLEADLGVDSIKRVQILGALQERFPGVPSLGPERLAEMRTLDHIGAFVLAELGDTTSADGVAGTPADAGPGDVAGEAAGGEVEGGPPGLARQTVELVAVPPVDTLASPYADGATAVVVVAGDAEADAAALVDELTARGFTAHTVALPAAGRTAAADPLARWDAAETERRLAAVLAMCGTLDLCVLVVAPGADGADDADGGWSTGIRQLADAVLVAKHAAGPLGAAAGRGGRSAFATLTRLDGGLGLRGDRRGAGALPGGVAGVVKTLARETPAIFCRAVDIDPAHTPAAAARLALAELFDPAADLLEVGVDAAGARWTVRPGPYGTQPPPDDGAAVGDAHGPLTVGPEDTLVVTGGARGVTAECVRALAAATGAQLVLLGRTAAGPDPDWAEGVADADLLGAAARALAAGGRERPSPKAVEALRADVRGRREVRATLGALGAAGATTTYLAVDIADRDGVRAALAPFRGRVTGVIHGAGALADSALTAKTADQVRRVLTPKLTGLRNVLDALADGTGTGTGTGDGAGAGDGGQPRHLLLFASVAGLMGNPGQADYAAANEALGRLAAAWKRADPRRHVTAIDWGAWDGGMVDADLRALFVSRGVTLIRPADGAAAFVDQFRERRAADVRVLVGSAAALTGAAGPRPAAALVARRDLAMLPADPVVADHRIGTSPVLPATLALGWLAHVAERAHPGMTVVEARGFDVHRGVVFDQPVGEDFEVRTEPAERTGDLVVVRAAMHGPRGIPRYRASVTLAGARPGPRRSPDWAGLDAAWTTAAAGAGDPPAVYGDGTLFHGPRLRGIRRILVARDDRLVVECQLAAADGLAGAFGAALHDPVLMDLLLQAPLVLARRLTGQATLPVAIERVEYLAPLPGGAPFAVSVQDVLVSGAGMTCGVVATDRAGRELVHLHGVAVVGTPDLAGKFVQGATPRREETRA